ncbi:hypothetical protein HMPREF1579_00825 [Gardnerella vaginalis JCP8066]|nr:hypothetical protein HMPREF1582_00746 [Gardnerella vaginalis JCP8151A]EPI59472.1 hypothetical protein HMPREF1579_00825 [Gardnerella vaginalis JCP8066]
MLIVRSYRVYTVIYTILYVSVHLRFLILLKHGLQFFFITA